MDTNLREGEHAALERLKKREPQMDADGIGAYRRVLVEQHLKEVNIRRLHRLRRFRFWGVFRKVSKEYRMSLL